MSKLIWAQTGAKTYETGVSNGVLYPQGAGGTYPKGVVWNGLISVSENPSGAEPTPLYADNQKYLNLMSTEEFAATIEAYTYPEEFADCDGSAEIAEGISVGQQDRKTFGFSYTTKLGNDTEGLAHGYKIHLVYGCLAAPSQRQFTAINDTPEANQMSWEITTTPVEIPGKKPSAHVIIDSTKTDEKALNKLKDILHGSEEEDARLPLPSEIKALVGSI